MENKYSKFNTQQYSKTNDSINTQFYKLGKPPQRLHYFFETQCDANPDITALICDTERLSYAELDARANQLANYLLRRGIRSGSRVGILLERSVNTYVTLLAILKCGAAFVPLDPSFPQDRIAFIAENASLNLLVTTSQFVDITAGVCCQVLLLDAVAGAIAIQPANRIAIADSVDELCYIIYTSGSTGRPKGVAVNHSSICNFLTVCTPIYGVTCGDRVYQGMILAFDFSIEEIWPTFIVGATLVAGPTNHRRLGSELTDFLIEHAITVMYCVPTLLATIDRDLPLLRTLIVGGEACPQYLVERWSRPERRMLNTYGPTETTVTALWTELFPDQPVTIGKPLPTYSVYILDEQLHPVPSGEAGEICIGGIGVAQGYVNLPEQTAAKFVCDPFEQNDPQARLYRTGDLGRVTPNDEIEYLGRIDTQVKIRGYRIELTEIETVLLETPDVENAIVSLVSISTTVEELVAYITLRVPVADSEELKNRLHTVLRHRLPSYMVPAFIEILDTIPTLPNGKADRSKLPAPTQRMQRQHRSDQTLPVTLSKQESAIANIWQKLFPHAQISIKDDFFLDLGGHSLLAASLVSQLREQPEFSHVSMLDVYQCPTIAGLATRLTQQTALPNVPTAPLPFHRTSRKRYLRSVTVQALGLIVILFCFALQWLLPYLTYTWMQENDASNLQSAFLSIATLAGIIPLMLGFSIVAKWLLLGQVKPGKYPLWGSFYLRWWFVKNLLSITPLHFLSGTPLLNVYYRLLGAKIGTNVYLNSVNIDVPDLVSIGADSSLGYEARLLNATLEHGWLEIGSIKIGNRCFVGASAVLSQNTIIEENASLEDLSMLPPLQRIPAREVWAGSPAAKVGINESKMISRPARLRRIYFGTLQAILLLTLPILELLPILPGVEQMYSISDQKHWLLLSPLIALSFVILMALQIAALKWLIVGRVKPGSYRLDSHRYVRLWYVDKLMALSLDIIRPLYATLYLLPWYRLLGAKLGWRAEISTPSSLVPDLVTIGDESFIADGVIMGVPRVECGRIHLQSTKIGKRAFIGNSALLPAGVIIGDDTLIGCMSVTPADKSLVAKPDTSWFGSPAINLPQRQVVQGFSVESTYKPPMSLVLQRMSFEAVRVLFPLSWIVVLSSVLIDTMITLNDDWDESALILMLPFLYLGFGLVATAITIIAKWLIIGRYKSTERPLWSNFVFRSELVTCIHETLAVPLLVDMLRGTPFINWYLRLMGCKIGKQVYTDTTDITEFDTIEVGNDVALNSNCGLQTHLFEDRVMKISTVTIGDRCSVGSGAIVLYDTVMEPDSNLGNLSMLMKGESLPASTSWVGSPARIAE
ncbi:peptide synthetase [Brasilonema octagenarum UFV-E1]|uniref:Peptide synthetase n=1 Tax=Brasilonema sennae CENA114 TaxID=415709 RepID=A0A856MKJ8_9CYAN|nr:Pls/PosA family non-ribosomal peptide synthetase [Brasilonema sennae]QDL11218.1 peptide synthetase [Brasilonema sennae CENA114]QDL17563.1 peptide synthetase [Brasilonema octagenarum UFV-E1]